MAIFELLFSREPRVLLCRYTAALTHENLDSLNVAVDAFVAREGAADGIVDFTAAPSTDFPTPLVQARARQRRVMPGHKRVFVVRDTVSYGMLRLYGAHQEIQGLDAPTIVWSLDEALEVLGATGATFEPV